MFGAPKKAPPTPKDLIKANKRQVQKSQHEIHREMLALDRQERETLAEIKKLAAKGQDAAVRVLAKQVVTIRTQRERLQKSHATLNGLKTVGSGLTANLAVVNAMSGAARVMSAVNSVASVEALSSAMQEMEKSREISEMQEDLLDELLEDSDEAVEVDDVMSAVFDEIGLDLEAAMSDERLSTGRASVAQRVNTAGIPSVSVSSGVSPLSPLSSTSSARNGVSATKFASPSSSRHSPSPASAASSAPTASSSALRYDEPLTEQEEKEAERLLAELGV